MEPPAPLQGYHPQHFFNYPFTLVSHPKRTFLSRPISQPAAYEVYCPLSCKKVKNGAAKGKDKEGLEFNTTSSRWISTIMNQNIKYLINKHPPNKKDKKKTEGSGWSFWLEVSEKGNYAIFNPYCTIPQDPLSIYTFAEFPKIERENQLEQRFSHAQKQQQIQEILVAGRTIYLSGRYISTNQFFDDSASGKVTLVHPSDSKKILHLEVEEAIKIVSENKYFWLWQLKKLIALEEGAIEELEFNLDQIYEKLNFNLNLEEQLRAKVMNTASISSKLNEYFGYHPRLYSAFSRLTSFANYGNTKHDIRKLAELGFYNKSDMLQDLAHFEFPDIPISSVEDPSYADQAEIRRKLLPFSRLERGLPLPNISLQTTISSLLPQEISKSPISQWKVKDNYIIFVDDHLKISIWSCNLFPVKLWEGAANNEQEKQKTALLVEQNEIHAHLGNVQKDESPLVSLFEEPPAPVKEEKPVEIVPEQSMLEQMQQMGYGVGIIKKALVAVKNESVAAAIDAIDQLNSEEKKKKVEKQRKEWSCPTCTYINKPTTDTCEMCGELCEVQDQSEKEKARLEQEKQLEAERKKEEERIRLEQQAEEKKRKEELLQAEKARALQEKLELLKKSELKCFDLLINSQSVLDPLFIVLIFWNSETQKSYLKVIRLGISRSFLSRFYRIEEKMIITNARRSILPLEYSSFKTIALQSQHLIEWGLKLIEPVREAEWGLSDLKQVDLDFPFNRVQASSSFFTLSTQEGKELYYQIKTNDEILAANFQLNVVPNIEIFNDNVSHPSEPLKIAVQEERTLLPGEELELDEKVSEVQIEILEHLPAGVWKNNEPLSNGLRVEGKQDGEVVMNEFIPLSIEHFEGSVFSGKHYSTSILEKGSNLYISNYPITNFTFRHSGGRQMLVESVVVVSTSKRLQRIFAVFEGLIFTANEPSWFHLAKQKFGQFTKDDYEKWLTSKRARNDHRDYWEPVGFFQIENEVQIQLDFKRSARYLFLLPTTVKAVNDKKKDEVYAVKLDFFGVKGRLEEEKGSETKIAKFKNEGQSKCDATLLQITQNGNEAIDSSQLIIKRVGHVNSFNFLSKDTSAYEKIPLSVTTAFSFKIRSGIHKKILKVTSNHSKSITIRLSREATEEVVDSSSVKSYGQLARVQNEFTVAQIKKITDGLDLRELLRQILQVEQNCNRFQSLLNKLEDSLDFKQKLFDIMIEYVPQLCEESIPVTETGFKFFVTIYEKALSSHLDRSFEANLLALHKITSYVNEHRNKNYNLLRLKYNIEELVLEPCLFSKDYYRLVHPNYVEEDTRPTLSNQPAGQINNCMWIEQINPYSYRQFIDLHDVRLVENIKFYVPKISTAAFRCKMSINIWNMTDNSEKLLYSRYFHEELLVQLGVNGFKDHQIYKGERLNCLTIPNIQTHARLIKVEVSFLLLTTQPNIRYKDVADKYYLIPLVESQPTDVVLNTEEKIKIIRETFPQQPKHAYTLERLPPSKYFTEGSKSIFHVHEFPVVELSVVKREYREIVEKITTNIMDQAIVRDSVKQIKLSNYQFNRKGLDFAYTYLILLMGLNRKFPPNLQAKPELLLSLFDTFVVQEAGPVNRKTFAFLQDTFRRLTNLQRNEFSGAIIDKYLLPLGQLQQMKVSERYSPLRVIEKIQQFELSVAYLFQKLENSSQKSLKLLLIKLISSTVTTHGLGDLEANDSQGSVKKLSLYNLICSSFKICLWILDNVQSIKEQALSQGLDLLLLFLMTGTSAPISELRPAAVKQFMQECDEDQIWKLVFLTLKLKSENLKERINKLFTVLTGNLTEKFKRSINEMLQQIIVREPSSIYVQINPIITDELWMNHLQTTLELITMTKDQLFLDNPIALRLLELPLTPTLWSLALHIIPRNDQILISIIRNFKREYYNSLGKEITKFCEPLAGIRSLESIHINWLDLVRKIRLEGKNVFELFVEQLQKSSFGGREGLTMATTFDVKQLQITCEFVKLVLEEKNLKQEYFSVNNIHKLMLWYFLNKSKEKGASPATDKILFLSQSVKSLFLRMIEFPEVVRICIKCVLDIRKESEVIERNFEEKRVPIHSALTLNRRFSECFEQILNVFMTSDELCSYFAFDLQGLSHILKTMNIASSDEILSQTVCPPDEELLLSEKLIVSKASVEQAPSEIKDLQDLKEEEFANNVKIVPHLNPAGLSASNVDWTVYKKGNKTKIIFLQLADATYHEYPLYLQLAKTVEVRSIKIGFPAASYEYNDKLVATPSAVVVEGSLDGVSYEPIGQMDYLQDDAYIVNGVQVWVLNCQKIRGVVSVGASVQELGLHKLRYLKVIVRRPVVSFIEGQFSQLNGRIYTSLGCSISFLSVCGDDADKLPITLLESCKQISKRSSLNVLSSLLNESNSITMRKIANDKPFAELVQGNFRKLKDYMTKYSEVMPVVIYLIGSGNRDLGDWIVSYFLKQGGGELEARIINQIITSTPEKAFERLRIFLASILRQLSTISDENEIESGLLYNKLIHYLEAFCKTLEECYELGLPEGQLECSQVDIDHVIRIYDSKHSSPEIKSLVKLLIYLLHIRAPLRLSKPLAIAAMDLIWQNCSDLKTHFYNLMAGLLIDRKAKAWIEDNSFLKVDQLIEIIYSTITHNEFRNLKLQLSLLSQISYHEAGYLCKKGVHLELYHKLKVANYQDQDIIDSVLKIFRNVVLGNTEEENKVAKILHQDVGLLVKRRDPFLQKLYVGILGLESEVMIHITGLDIRSTKKDPTINSKYLTKKNQKVLFDRLNKKAKYHLLGQINGEIKVDHQELFLKAFSCNSLLLVIRFKINQNLYTCGVYSGAPSKRSQDGDYLWEEIISYDKQGFIYFLNEAEPLFITNSEGMLGNIYGGDEQQENAAIFYDSGSEVIQFTFSTDSSVPKLTFSKYKNLPEEVTSNCLDADYESYSFVGLEFWQLKTNNVINVAGSKISNLLSKSNHAKPPFSYYRHAPIYVFPANITLAKFMQMLSFKGICQSRGAILGVGQTLVGLEHLSNDFIIDLDIQSQQEVKEDKQEPSEIGYIPEMTIFNHFSSLEGVSEVLRLGAESISDWKKADRKKNFEHYMDQLRSFINLPNFFSLFIKNQQYVTLLFEVASGMPDDESSTRNWQEEYVNNFRFIYKIVSDIFKYDRSPELRAMDKYADFVEVILEKLSEISKQAPRILKQEEIPESSLAQTGGLELVKTQSEDRKRKKKGIGYGADNQNNSKWSASQWLEARKNVSQQTLRVASIMVSFLDCQDPLRDERLTEIIKESCLLPLLESALRSGSLLDISKQAELFKSYLQIIRLLSSHPSTIECLLDLEKRYKPEQSQSIFSLLVKLNSIAQIFTECLKSGKEQVSTNEAAESIAIDIHKTHIVVDKAVRNLKKKGKGITVKELNSMPVAVAYRYLLQGQRFGYVNLKEGNVFKHAHASSITSSNPPTSKILRLSQELADLSSSLPCEHTNSIFVRCDKSRIDVINILIMGSKDTPYSNGAFTFDVYCDDSYPNNPPKMLITTTGQGKIRFNPNLYSCGKVCLSLLGTWRGSASENWDPKVSTLLQLFISTQGITMSDDVYFNEPGFEGEQGTDQGERKNEAYSNIVRLGNVRYAMNGQIKNPPKGFEQVVKRHFYIKRKQILEECDKWVEYAQKREASYNGLVNDHNSSWCSELKQSKTKYKELLVKEIEELRQLLNNLPPPDLKEQQEEQHDFAATKDTKLKQEVKTQHIKLEEVDVGYDKEQQVKSYEEHVMHDRWSRYIGAMGLEAVKKQAQSSVLLIGLKPLGLEIAKNLVLSGLKKLTIVEEDTITDPDEHFFMSNLKGKAIKQCIFKIKELNPYMLVDYCDKLPDLNNYSVVISTLSYDQSLDISQLCRKSNVKFLYAETKGVSGIYFADLGLHDVNDDNGEESFEGIIKSITNAEEGIVTLLDGIKHPYQDGDYIILSKVEGMDLIQETIEEKSEAQLFFEQQSNEKPNGINNRAFKVKVINWNSFSIGDTRNFEAYKSNGLVRNIKIPKKVQYQSLEVCEKEFDKFLDSNLGIYDFEKMGDNLNIFLSFQALSQYQRIHKSYPNNWSSKDASEFIKIFEEKAKHLNKPEEELKKLIEFAKNFSFVSEAELPTIGAYLGGLVSQEAIKAITNKYMPIRQFFVFHINQMQQKIPEAEEDLAKLAVLKGEAFRNIKIVVGTEGASKIEELKTFVIGAGAIGCQLLKNFAMINMGAKGEIVVTDPDHIETSNLSRQFLFREKHVKKAKSATACATLLQLNKNLEGHIIAKLDKVCEETEESYSNEFFKSRHLVANALDNVRARQYMDKRCVQNKIPLFQSGTLGPKGHVQVIVPFKTENYGSQNDPNEEAQIPHCTLKMFPEETVHCIEWARDIFGKIFTLNPKALKKVIQAKDLNALEGQEKQTVAKMIKYRPESFDDCIAQAVRKFYVNYRNNVRQLLFTYPLDMQTKEGKPFWQLPKRPPKQINELDENDQSHRTFISAYAVLLAKTFSIPFPKDFRKTEGKLKIMEVARKVKVENFVPSEQTSKQIQKEVEKESVSSQTESAPPVQQSVQNSLSVCEQVQLTSDVLDIKVIPEQFEKDQDGNGHIDLIYSMSNLRCKNYGLSECTWIEAKLKAGKIMAALSTTTSVVAALQTIQIIKLAVGCTTWRNAFINIAVPIIQISEPGPAIRHKIGNTDFSVWEDWSFKCETLNDLLQQLKQKYEVEAYNISTNEGKPVYWEAMYKDKQEARETLLNSKLSNLFKAELIQLHIALRRIDNGENYEHVPKIRVETI